MQAFRSILSWFLCALIVFAIASMCVLPAHGQDVTNLYMAGGSYSAGATPAFAGTAGYAHQVNGSGTYAFTLIDAVPNTVKPFTVTTNVGIGVAQKVATIGGYSVFMPTAAGISYTGKNTGWAWTTGAFVPVRVDAKRGIYLIPSIRVLKSSVSNGTGYQPIFGLMFGVGQ